jgi:murein DD-endopeptidase MepM/ murein hydrolase activator NlpD
MIEIEVFDYKERIFNGLLSQFHDSGILSYDTRTELRFVLTAEWRENEYNDYHGEAVYNINVIYEVPALFSISDHQAVPGDIIIITVSNAGENSALRLSAPELEHETEFTRHGANKIAFVPVAAGFSGELNINITGDYTADYQVIVNPGISEARNVSTHEDNIPVHLSENSRHERRLKHEEILGMPSASQNLWQNNFINPSPRDINVLFAFGTDMTVNGGNAYVNQGVNLFAEVGDTIFAGNAGRVIFTGRLPFDGNLIIIDHGAGLKTWYARLNQINVEVGDTVEQGQEIATFGGSGMPADPWLRFYFAASVGDIFINPLNLLNLDIDLGVPDMSGDFTEDDLPVAAEE